jgi:hypothetical protein
MGAQAPDRLVPARDRARLAVLERLRSRRAEIEGAIFARVHDAVPDPARDDDPELTDGLRKTIGATLDYFLEAIERDELPAGGPPQAALAQARRAARSAMPLDTVLRRYVAGHLAIWHFVLDAIERAGAEGEGRTALLHRASYLQSSFFDQLVGSIAEEYARERERSTRYRAQRDAELVSELLSGAISSAGELDYDFDAASHLGLIANGTDAEGAVRSLAASLDARLLTVARGEQTLWAWLAFRDDPGDVPVRRLARHGAGDCSLALGEPAPEIEGFRLTHRQARIAYRVALRRPQALTRYRDVVLVALALEDERVGRSLIEMYLAPLDGPRDRGQVLRETLRAYFSTGQNASSAAALLGVHERTIRYRLRVIEECLARPPDECRAELETALKLEGCLPIFDKSPGRSSPVSAMRDGAA